jgi:ABC-type uncharacterized transport system fused permease/ATPase subunit
MSAINSALSAIDEIATEGDLTLDVADLPLELDTVGDPVTLPDGRRIYPPRLHGEPIDELACKLLDLDRPSESTFLRLTGPPGTGKSMLARAIAFRLWQQRRTAVTGSFRQCRRFSKPSTSHAPPASRHSGSALN